LELLFGILRGLISPVSPLSKPYDRNEVRGKKIKVFPLFQPLLSGLLHPL
jgi:hypothetical protein